MHVYSIWTWVVRFSVILGGVERDWVRKVERLESILRVGSAGQPAMAVFPCRRARRVVSEEDVKRGATPLCSALLCDTHSAHPNIPAAKCGAQYNCRLAELQMRPAAQLRTERPVQNFTMVTMVYSYCYQCKIIIMFTLKKRLFFNGSLQCSNGPMLEFRDLYSRLFFCNGVICDYWVSGAQI